jgi:NRPS condensation-like uncharacterized protein
LLAIGSVYLTQIDESIVDSISTTFIENSPADNSDLLFLEEQMPRTFAAGEIDMLTHVFSCTADQQINCVLYFNGHFNRERMERAVKLTFYTEPVLGSRFITTEKKAYWERRDDLHTLEFITFSEPDNLEQAVDSFITSPINPMIELPLRVAFFRHKEGDTLCLKVSHEALDGQGIKEYLGLLASYYSKLEKDPNFLPEPRTTIQRSLGQVFKGMGFFKRLGVYLQLRIRTPTWSLPWKSTEAKTRRFAIRKIAAEQFLKIKAYSKKLKVTISDIIATAFHRAMHRLVNVPINKKMFSTLTVNLRKYLPNLQATSLCNLTASSHPHAKYIPDETFEETLKQIHASTKQFKRKGAGLEAALFCKLLFSMKFSKAQDILEKSIQKEIKLKATFPVITNIGLVKETDLGFDGLDIRDGFIVSPFMKAPGFLMGVATLDQTMVLSMGYFEESYDTKIVNHFLDYLKDELTSL